MVRAFASHHCGPGLMPETSDICGLSFLLVLVLAPRVFSPGTCPPVFPPSSKTNIFKFQFDLEYEGHSNLVPRTFSSTDYSPSTARSSVCSSISRISLSADVDRGFLNESHHFKGHRNTIGPNLEKCGNINGRKTPELISLPSSDSAQSGTSNFQEASYRIFDSQPTARVQNVPAMANCTSCGIQVLTCTEYRVSSVNWALAGLLCAFGCHLGCCVVPFFLNSFKDVIHICPLCKTQLHEYCKG